MVQERRLLVVEDDPATRNAMRLVLACSGYGVATASNGQEALDLLHHDPRPCLILLDLMMPVMDGWQFRNAQRHDPTVADVPVVVISADTGVEQKAADLGAAGYVAKPVDLEDLLKTVRRYC